MVCEPETKMFAGVPAGVVRMIAWPLKVSCGSTIWSLAAGVTFQVGDAPAGVNAVPLRVQLIEAVYAPASVDALPVAMMSRR